MGSENGHSENEKHGASHRKERMFFMKKKLFPLILAVLLLFTACSAPGNSQRGKELGYFNYPGLDWGMTEAEFFKAIGKSENSFRAEKQIHDENAYSQFYVLESIECFGETAASIGFEFSSDFANATPRLTSIQISYAGDIDFDAVYNNAHESISNQEVLFHEPILTLSYKDANGYTKYVTERKDLYENGATSVHISGSFISQATVSDLPESSIEKVSAGYSKIHKSADFTPDWLSLRGSEPLSSLQIAYNASLDEEGKVKEANMQILFTGSISDFDIYGDLA